MGLKSLYLTHSNCYGVLINIKDVVEFEDNEKFFRLGLKENYRYKEHGHPVWGSIKPLDKDEIVRIDIETDFGVKDSFYVPFNNVSSNGSYSINSKSKNFTNGNTLYIEWSKS